MGLEGLADGGADAQRLPRHRNQDDDDIRGIHFTIHVEKLRYPSATARAVKFRLHWDARDASPMKEAFDGVMSFTPAISAPAICTLR